MPFSAIRRDDRSCEVRGLRATASAALLAWGMTWTVGALHAAPTGHVEPRRPTPVTGKVSVDAPAAVAPPAVSTAVQVPAPAHLPAAPYDLQAPTHGPGAVVGAAAVTPVAKPASDQAAVRVRDVSRETHRRTSATAVRSVKLAPQGGGKVVGTPARQGHKHVTTKADRASVRAATGQTAHKGVAPKGVARTQARKPARGPASAKLAQKPSQVLKRSAAQASATQAMKPGAGQGVRVEAKAAKAAKKSGAVPKAMASAATTKPAKPAHMAHSAKVQASRAQASGPASKARAGHTEAAARARKSGKATDVAKAGAGTAAHRRTHPRGA